MKHLGLLAIYEKDYYLEVLRLEPHNLVEGLEGVALLLLLDLLLHVVQVVYRGFL